MDTVLAAAATIYPQSEVTVGNLPAVVGGSFTLSGAASCDMLKDIPGDEAGIFVRHADESLTSVQVRIGGASPVPATPTGPADRPWTSWTLTASGLPGGPVTLVAQAFPSKDPATAGRSTVVDR